MSLTARRTRTSCGAPYRRALRSRLLSPSVLSPSVLCACALLVSLGVDPNVANADTPLPRVLRRALPSAGALWPRAPLVDVGAALVGAPAARAETGLDGSGAVICVVDTGLDLGAPTFRDAADHTRVRWLLDLDAPPRGVHVELEARFGGAVYDGAELDALGAAAPGDWHGHGTAMTAVAAGDDADVGASAPGPWAGAAPSSALVVVRALRRGVPGFRDPDIALGARFCFAVAGLGPRPTSAARTVVLLGSGGHDGAHDGTTSLELALSELADQGHAVVVAAGNDGGRLIHAAADVEPGSPVTIPLFVPSPVGAPGARSVALALYADVSSALRVSMLAPDGSRTRDVSVGERSCVDHAGGRICVDAASLASDPAAIIHAVATGGADVPQELGGGRYGLRVSGRGHFDVWVAGSDLGIALGRAEFSGPAADDRVTVTIPATAAGVFAVGSAVSRSSTATTNETSAGDVSPHSARGPDPLGRPKPDLIAPADYVLVPLSSGVHVGDSENLFAGLDPARVTRVDDAGRVALAGSSFAAPWVAGALALAYSDSVASTARDFDLLRATADTRDAGPYTPFAGAGLLRVDAFLAARRSEQVSAVASRSSFALTAPGGWLVVRLLDAAGAPARGRIELVGTSAPDVDVVAGWAAFPVPPDTADHQRIRVDGTNLGRLSTAPSGCAVSSFGPGVPPHPKALWLLLGLSALVLRRRRSAGSCARSRRCCPRRGACVTD